MAMEAFPHLTKVSLEHTVKLFVVEEGEQVLWIYKGMQEL